jgi:transcriptional regulator with XRE-family HTH domain
MKSGANDLMPTSVERSLRKLGRNIAVARKKRRLTVQMMLERTGLSKGTYARVEAGEATVAIGAYAMCLLTLGHAHALGDLLDEAKDDVGLLLDKERLPKRVRLRKEEMSP